MRKKNLWMLALAMVLSLASCSEKDNPVADNPTVEDLAEATVIWYGTGGGNVDAAIMNNFRQFYRAQPGSYDRVNIVAQYKVSAKPTIYYGMTQEEVVQEAESMAAERTEEEMEEAGPLEYFWLCHPKEGATYRFVLDAKKTLRQQLHETEPYGELNCDFTCPDSLTNFINWAAAHYPAKKYILVMADHGGGYLPHKDLPEQQPVTQTRGLIFDDGYSKKCFSAKSFARAVRNAKVRPEGIVLYLCLMNNMEFLYEAKDVTDYIAASTYSLTGKGGALQSIVDNMAAGFDTETALGNFVDDTMDSIDDIFYDPAEPDAPYYYDMTLTKTSRLNDLAPLLREFTDRLVDVYQNGTDRQRIAIDICTSLAVKVQNTYPFYDMAKFMKTLFVAMPDVFDDELNERIKTAFNACIAKQRNTKYLTSHNYQVDYSVLLGHKGCYATYSYTNENKDPVLGSAKVYEPDGTMYQYNYKGEGYDNIGITENYELANVKTWSSTFADTYQQTTFDRLVGWSRWLLINETPPPAWSACSLKFQLPEGDVSDIPII